MASSIGTAQLDLLAQKLLPRVEEILRSQEFWIQIAVILLVFIIARWIITPPLKILLRKWMKVSQRIVSFHRLLNSLHDFSNTIVWLFLQWFSIKIFISLQRDHYVLTAVASLLSAWLLIRLASKLLHNVIAARVVATIAWTLALLHIFGWLPETLNLLDSMSVSVGSVRLSPLVIIKAALTLWFFIWLANGMVAVLDRRLESSVNVTPVMRVLGVKLLRIGMITLAVLITFTAVGIDLTALAVFGGALGVGLGFGLQKIFSNLVSGVILLMDRSIKPGDVISVGETFGWINLLSARYVSVITRDGIEHLIPNEVLITERVENWSFSDNLVRLKIPIGISYKADVRKAMQACHDAALDTQRILTTPEPRCLLKGFGDSSVNLELRVWIDDPANGRSNVISDVLLGVWDRFHEQHIEIPFPQRDLHIRSGLEKFDPASQSDINSGEESP